MIPVKEELRIYIFEEEIQICFLYTCCIVICAIVICAIWFFVSFINCTVLVSMLCGSVRTKGIHVPSTYVRICTALLCLVYYL